MSNTQLEELLVEQPEKIEDEIIRINTDARPLALQVALLIPILAALVGVFISLRVMRIPDRPRRAPKGWPWADNSPMVRSGRPRRTQERAGT